MKTILRAENISFQVLSCAESVMRWVLAFYLHHLHCDLFVGNAKYICTSIIDCEGHIEIAIEALIMASTIELKNMFRYSTNSSSVLY